MKATGIVRRIDELGRVVIPKEIRRTMRLKEGEELEIYTTEDELVFKKFSAISAIDKFSAEYVKTLATHTGATALICDNDSVIDAAGTNAREYKDKMLSSGFYSLMANRKDVYLTEEECVKIVQNGLGAVKAMAISPILSAGDIYGSVVLLSDQPLSESDRKLCSTAAEFISFQL